MQKLISYKDMPLGVPNEVPLAIMSRVLKEDITVVLSGEGADELFGGYGRIYRFPLYAKYHLNISSPSEFWRVFSEEYEYVPRSLRDTILFKDLTEKVRSRWDSQMIERVRRYFPATERFVFDFFHNVHLKGLLYRLDMTTMQASVEGRVPFVDHELIEKVYRYIPYNLKLRWNNRECYLRYRIKKPKCYSEICDVPKYILKKVAEKYLPRTLVYRRKMGFPVPLNIWHNNELKSIATDLLSNAIWLKEKEINTLLKRVSRYRNAGQILWMLVNVEMWYQKYFR